MPPPITLKSPLPAADLLFESMTSSAALSSLGETQLNLLSPKSDLKPEDLLGKAVTVTVQLRDDAKRHFNGFVSRFGAGRHQGRYFAYQATVNPWLWFLTRTSDCRIFQDQTVPEIVKKVFEDHGIAKFEFKTFRTYRKWVYCVQYRESDYNFVARLLEHEGIYWYFEHTDSGHKLLLVDSQSAHDAAPACESLPYVEHGARPRPTATASPTGASRARCARARSC
jgi:type VI secretion system secreted protein VgrG